MASHIKRHSEEQKKHTIFFSILGSILIILFLAIYGLPLFTKYILYLGNSKSPSNITPAQDGINYVAPPVLDDTFSATNSAIMTVKGIASKNQEVKLFVNGSIVDQQTTDNKGKFTFNNVSLTPGSNQIETKAYAGANKESSYSNVLNITYLNKGPTLNIVSPVDNQSFSGSSNQTLHIQGNTDPNCNVTINGSWAIVNSDGSFTYDFPLQNGDNHITFVSTDQAGNTTTVQRKVTFNP